MDCFASLAMTDLTLRLHERPILQERDRLRDRDAVSHEPRVRCVDQDMVGHAIDPGVFHRYPAVMRFRQHLAGQRVDRAVSRHDANRIIQRWKQRIDRIVPLCTSCCPAGPKKAR